MPGRDTAKVRNTDRISSLTSKSSKRAGPRDASGVRPPKKRVKRSFKRVDYHSSSDEDDGHVLTGLVAEEADTSNKASGANGRPLGLRGLRNVTLAEPANDEGTNNPEDTAKPENDEPADDVDDEDDIEEDEENIDDLEEDEGLNSDSGEDDSAGLESEEEEGSTSKQRMKKKRADPTAFATSMSKILASGLSVTKRADPVLSRSKNASDAVKEVSEQRLEARARHKLRDEKRQAMDRGRVRDVLGLQDSAVSTQAIQEDEKRLRKLAQRGVVKLFNAVRAAQARAEETQVQQKTAGTVGMQKREEKVNEMSKQGFLDLIAAGGK